MKKLLTVYFLIGILFGCSDESSKKLQNASLDPENKNHSESKFRLICDGESEVLNLLTRRNEAVNERFIFDFEKKYVDVKNGTYDMDIKQASSDYTNEKKKVWTLTSTNILLLGANLHTQDYTYIFNGNKFIFNNTLTVDKQKITYKSQTGTTAQNFLDDIDLVIDRDTNTFTYKLSSIQNYDFTGKCFQLKEN